jgi:hypothetical protein
MRKTLSSMPISLRSKISAVRFSFGISRTRSTLSSQSSMKLWKYILKYHSSSSSQQNDAGTIPTNSSVARLPKISKPLYHKSAYFSIMSFGGFAGAYCLIISSTFVRSSRSGSLRHFQSIVVSVLGESANCDEMLFTLLFSCQGFMAQTLHV